MGAVCAGQGQRGLVARPDRKNLTPSSTQNVSDNTPGGKRKRASVTSSMNEIGGSLPKVTGGSSNKVKGGTATQVDDGKGEQKTPGVNPSNGSQSTGDLTPRKMFKYKKGPLIGKGTVGEVYECLNLETGQRLAVKSVSVHGDITKLASHLDALKKEVEMLRQLSYPSIVKYFLTDIAEAESGKTIVDIVLEYVSGGSLKSLLSKFGKLDESVISTYSKQILEGLAYLHQNNIVHRDIKSSNILLDASGKIKLTDFGCSKRLNGLGQINSGGRSIAKTSVFWQAPEVVAKREQGMPSDIWSVGCVALEMFTGYPPWTDMAKSQEEVPKLILSGKTPYIPKNASEYFKRFLLRCFQQAPADRPTSHTLLDDEFLTLFEDPSYGEYDSMKSGKTNQFELSENGKLLGANNPSTARKTESGITVSNIQIGGKLNTNPSLNALNSRGLTNELSSKVKTGEFEFIPSGTSIHSQKDVSVKPISPAIKAKKMNPQTINEEEEDHHTPPKQTSMQKKAMFFKEEEEELKPNTFQRKEMEALQEENRLKWEQQMMMELQKLDTEMIKTEVEHANDEEFKVEAHKIEDWKEKTKHKWEEEMKAELMRLEANNIMDDEEINKQTQSKGETLLSKQLEIEHALQQKKEQWSLEINEELASINNEKLKNMLFDTISKQQRKGQPPKLNVQKEVVEEQKIPEDTANEDKEDARRRFEEELMKELEGIKTHTMSQSKKDFKFFGTEGGEEN